MSKERPILFNGEMVRAILDGRKTQTRRVIKPQPPNCKGRWAYIASSTERSEVGKFRYSWPDADGNAFTSRGRESGVAFRCPFGAVGDQLWVRETFAGDYGCGFIYAADHPNSDIRKGDLDDGEQTLRRWTPSIHMPRDASRITLEIVGVRVERLNDISEADAMAEGVTKGPLDPWQSTAFMRLWESINGPESWAANPWVWVLEFKKV